MVQEAVAFDGSTKRSSPKMDLGFRRYIRTSLRRRKLSTGLPWREIWAFVKRRDVQAEIFCDIFECLTKG